MTSSNLKQTDMCIHHLLAKLHGQLMYPLTADGICRSSSTFTGGTLEYILDLVSYSRFPQDMEYEDKGTLSIGGIFSDE